LSGVFPDQGLLLVGSSDEADLAQRIGTQWSGPVLNVCGRLTPRESAAAIRHAMLYIGHDGGPMHLASAVGTTCVAVFSARSKPGVWYPYGAQHRVLYHRTACFGCALETCVKYKSECIRSITVDEVYDAVLQATS
jgi:ADP-heptose:LPS heptosyltransferase